MGTTMVSIRVPDESLAKIDEGARRLKTSRSQLMVTGALALLALDAELPTVDEPELPPAVPSLPSPYPPEPATADQEVTPEPRALEAAWAAERTARQLRPSVDVTPFFKNLKKSK